MYLNLKNRTKCRFITVLSLFAVLCFHSCQKDVKVLTPERGEAPQSVSLDSRTKNIFSDSLYRNINFLVLDELKQGIIGQVDKVIIKDNLILLLDRQYSKSIYAFDNSGKHLFTIGKKGQGPGEFVFIEDFDVSEGHIYIYDSGNGNLSLFDLLGNFESYSPKLSKIGVVADALSILNNSVYTYSQASCSDFGCYTLTVSDRENQLLYQDIPNKHLNNFFVDFGKNMFRHEEKIYVSQIFNDTIYQIDKTNKVTTPFVLNYERTSNELKTIKNAVSNRRTGLSQLMDSKANIGTVKIYASDTHIWVKNFDENKLVNIIIPLQKEEAPFVFEKILFNIQKSLPFSEVVGSSKNQFIFHINNEQLLNFKSDKNISSDLLDLINSGTNGVLVFSEIRNRYE